MGNMKVESIDLVKVKELLKDSPKLIRDYVKSLERCYEMSQQTNKLAIRKIRELAKDNDGMIKTLSFFNRYLVSQNETKPSQPLINNLTIESLKGNITVSDIVETLVQELDSIKILNIEHNKEQNK